MISIKYLYIGIDDTDSPDGMCTTYLASQIINEFRDNGIELVDYPRLIRLNPFARHKTRGNGGVALKIPNDSKAALAKEIVLESVERLSMFDCDNTNPGVIFYDGEITKEMDFLISKHAAKGERVLVLVKQSALEERFWQ